MPLQISRIPDLPVIIFKYVVAAKVPDDANTTLKEVTAFKHERGGHVYRIIDLTSIKVDFSQMMVGMGAELGQEGGANDPDVTTLFVVTTDILRLGVEALRSQEQYGKAATVFMFETQDEALAFARKDIAK